MSVSEFPPPSDCALPSKPRYASPCNHCGLCCTLALCEVGAIAFHDQSAPCPALVVLDGKALCGIVLTEERAGMEPVARKVLGIGCGCSMEDDDTTREQAAEFDRRARAMAFGHTAP